MRHLSYANPDFNAFAVSQGRPGDAVQDLYGVGPDWATGYGVVNAAKALDYVDTLNYLEDTIGHLQIREYSVTVPANTESMRFTLAWDDRPPTGALSRLTAFENKIVNELDLYVVSPNRDTVYRPWVVDYTAIKPREVPVLDSIVHTEVRGSYVRGISPDTVLAYPATPGVQRRDVVEVVDIPSPPEGEWVVVVEGPDIVDSQSIAGTLANPKQDFSLVFDITAGGAANAEDVIGPVVAYEGAEKARGTEDGKLQLGGEVTSGPLDGLIFGGSVSVNADGDLLCSALSSNQGAWLDSPANLAGGLVVRRPDQTVTMHMASSGEVRIRDVGYENMGDM